MNEVLRDADRRELEASSGREALKVLVDSIRISTKSIVGLYDGKIIALFGVAPEVLLEGRGCVWMVGSKYLPKIPRVFLTYCEMCMNELKVGYNYLFNHVDARNKIAINWLKWLGFTIEEAKPYGAYKLPFHRFYLEVK